MAGSCGAPELIPRVALGWIHAVRVCELGGQGEFKFAGVPQPQSLVDNRAAIEVGMGGDIGVYAGEQIGVERGGDFGTTADGWTARHGHSVPTECPSL